MLQGRERRQRHWCRHTGKHMQSYNVLEVEVTGSITVWVYVLGERKESQRTPTSWCEPKQIVVPFTRTFLRPDPRDKKTFLHMEFPLPLLSREERTSLDIFLDREKRQPHYFISALVGCNFGSTQFINKFRIAYLSLLFSVWLKSWASVSTRMMNLARTFSHLFKTNMVLSSIRNRWEIIPAGLKLRHGSKETYET